MKLFGLMMSILVLDAFAAGCVGGVATSESAQAIDGPCEGSGDWDCRCSGCSANGVTPGEWNAMFNEADANGLRAWQAWASNGDGPVRLCAAIPAAGATSCTLHPAWRDWLHAGTNRRFGMMTNFVKVIAAKGFTVEDPGGYTYHGAFGLATEALRETPWSYRSQELLVGGMLALINVVHGVPVCLKSRHTPNNCAGLDAGFYEITTFGSTFRTHFGAVAGGTGAPDPGLNLRYGTVPQTSATKFLWPDGKCTTTGAGVTALATQCTDQYGRSWLWPVTSITTFRPADWYYVGGGVPKPRPPEVPQTR